MNRLISSFASLATLTAVGLAAALPASAATPAAPAAAPAPAPASGALLVERNLPLELANRIAAAGVAACSANGYAVTTTVVDRGGVVRAVQRADKAGPHTVAASEQKAFTSVSAKANTQAMMEGSQKNPGAANLVSIPGFLLLGGGVPIRAGTEVVGAVGISGAPGGHLDEQCAITAIDQVKAALQ